MVHGSRLRVHGSWFTVQVLQPYSLQYYSFEKRFFALQALQITVLKNDFLRYKRYRLQITVFEKRIFALHALQYYSITVLKTIFYQPYKEKKREPFLILFVIPAGFKPTTF